MGWGRPRPGGPSSHTLSPPASSKRPTWAAARRAAPWAPWAATAGASSAVRRRSTAGDLGRGSPAAWCGRAGPLYIQQFTKKKKKAQGCATGTRSKPSSSSCCSGGNALHHKRPTSSWSRLPQPGSGRNVSTYPRVPSRFTQLFTGHPSLRVETPLQLRGNERALPPGL